MLYKKIRFGFNENYLRTILFSTIYAPIIALNVNPINPIADISNIFGPLFAKIVNDEPISKAERIKDAEIWFLKIKFRV